MTTKYHGTLVTYCEDVSSGVVTDIAGRNYAFHINDWNGLPADLIDDMELEFQTSAGRAIKVSRRA